MKKTFITLVIGICIGLLISILGPDIKQKNPNDTELTAQKITLERVKEVAKIVSVEYYMADIISYKDERIWPFSDKKILVIAKAKILAGFNLTKGVSVTVQEIQEPPIQDPQEHNDTGTTRRRQLVITLPPPEIIAIHPDYKYYDIQGNPPPEAHTYVLNLAKVTLYNTAKQEGILLKAKSSCRKQIQQIFSEFDVVVNFYDDIEETKG